MSERRSPNWHGNQPCSTSCRIGVRRSGAVLGCAQLKLGSRGELGNRLGMTATEQAILGALLELDATAKRMATANPKPSLAPLLARLDQLAAQLPADSDPELRHFLQRKSYEKARLHLQDFGERKRQH